MGNDPSLTAKDTKKEKAEPGEMRSQPVEWDDFRAQIVNLGSSMRLWVKKIEPGRRVKFAQDDQSKGHGEWIIYKSSDLYYMLALTDCENKQLYVKPSKGLVNGGRVLVLGRGKTPLNNNFKLPDRRTFTLVDIPQNGRTALFHVKSKRYLCYHARKKQLRLTKKIEAAESWQFVEANS